MLILVLVRLLGGDQDLAFCDAGSVLLANIPVGLSYPELFVLLLIASFCGHIGTLTGQSFI
jgi:hypothetical protein